MDKQIDQSHIDKFIQRIEGELPEPDHQDISKVITYLVSKGILPTSRVRDYVITTAFHDHVTNAKGTRNGFCAEMEAVYDLSQRQIHNVIGRNFKRFYLESHIKE